MRFFLILLALLFAATPLTADAATKHHHAKPRAEKQLIPNLPTVDATYDIYVGGIHFITADIEFKEVDGKYHARVLGHTHGFWYRLLPWNTDLDATGTISGDHFVPAEFFTHDVWGKKAHATKIHFKKDGNVTAEFDPPKTDDKHEPLTADQLKDSLDPVTALLQMLAHLAIQKDCNLTVPVFDGHLLFNITANDEGTEDIDEEDYGIYKGTTRTCTANFTLIGGEEPNKIKSRFWYKSETERGREPFKLFLAQPKPELPELPVRIESDSLWGMIVIHLSSWQTVK